MTLDTGSRRWLHVNVRISKTAEIRASFTLTCNLDLKLSCSIFHRLKFGLYHVNFTDQNRQRTPKLSAYIFSEINRKRRLPRCFPEATWAFSLKSTMPESTKEHNPTDSFLASQHEDPGSCKRKYFPFSSKFLAAWLATLI
jgi:hypothetical protein